MDLKIDVGRLSAVSLTQGISHGGISKESQKTLLKESFLFRKVCRQVSAGGALSSFWGFSCACRQGGRGFGCSTRQCFADRCLKRSSLLPAGGRQVPAPSANKLGPDTGGKLCFSVQTPRARYLLHKGIFPPIQEHDPALILELESTKSVASLSPVCSLQESS